MYACAFARMFICIFMKIPGSLSRLSFYYDGLNGKKLATRKLKFKNAIELTQMKNKN